MSAATAARVKVDAAGKRTEISASKQKSITVNSRLEVKGKTIATTSRKTTTKTATVRSKSEKKVYTLPGQKFDPPEEREPLRIFYESLSKQIPTSAMAEVWMMEHGLLSPERARKAYERKQRRQQQQRMGTPVKSQKIGKPETSRSQLTKNNDIKVKKRVKYDGDNDDDDDYIIKPKKQRF